MRRIFVLLVGLGLTALHTAQAQQISFDDAVRIALEQNLTIKRGENSLRTQEIAVQSDKDAFLPSVSASSSTGRNWGLTFDATTLRLVTRSSDRFSLGGNASVNLFNGFADVASLEQSRLALSAQEQTFERTRQNVVFTVISSYLQVILDREQIAIRQEDLGSQQQQLDRIQEFVRVGSRPVADLYTQQATLAASEASLLTAQRSLQLSESRLIQVLQLDPLGAYEFAAPSSDAISLAARDYDIESLMRNAFERRPDIQAQEFGILAAEQGIRIAKSGYLPRINLSGGINTSYSSLAVDPITRLDKGFFDQLGDNRSESISLSLNIPIFDRFVTKRSIERSRVQLDNAELDLETVRQTVALELRQAYLDYQTAVKRLDVTDKQLTAAKQALDVEQERYNVGVSTLVELTQARSRWVDAAGQRVQAIFQFHFQHKVIEYYQGVLDPADLLF